MTISLNGQPLSDQQRAQLQNLLNTPQEITASGALTVSQSGSNLVVNSASAVSLALPETADNNVVFRGINIGVGAVTFATINSDAIYMHDVLPNAIDQYSPFEIRRIPGGWVRVA